MNVKCGTLAVGKCFLVVALEARKCWHVEHLLFHLWHPPQGSHPLHLQCSCSILHLLLCYHHHHPCSHCTRKTHHRSHNCTLAHRTPDPQAPSNAAGNPDDDCDHDHDDCDGDFDEALLEGGNQERTWLWVVSVAQDPFLEIEECRMVICYFTFE